MIRVNKNLLWILLTLAAIPFLLHVWFSRKDKSYDELIQRYECNPGVCEADFNGDESPERVERVKRSSTSIEEVLVVKDGDREILSVPYEYVDGTLKTHVAIRRAEAGDATLLVFDGTRGGEPQRNAFRWNGRQLVEVTPSPEDIRILTAMAARDNAGTWVIWGLYRAFLVPMLLAYYTVLVLAFSLIAGFRWLRRRTSKAT